MLRRALFSAVLLAGAFALTGCGGKENTVNTPGKNDGANPGKPGVPPPPEPIPPPPRK